MYAQGDTSNVTIPSLFTSHTTAHLLSSLLPGGAIAGPLAGHSGIKGASDTTTTEGTTSKNAGNILSVLGLGPGSLSVVKATGRGHDEASTPPIIIESERGEASPQYQQRSSRSVKSIIHANSDEIDISAEKLAIHRGLWVTLTPTNVSTSPFFDTLLVLVVSPLVTLTVVYALLLLRSRIRRRRWRAPKSLVERLTVRTYQTMSDSASSATPSAASPTTPLLQHSSSSPVSPIHRLQADVPDDGPATSSAAHAANRAREEEKRETGLAEWRRRYGGRQKECVVCLDEYVDGVSQVMSLPCGHEFHAECM
jgi:hypothetical protein